MSYRFLPYVRRALLAGIKPRDDGSPLRARASLPVVLSVNKTAAPTVEVETYGPGDIQGVDIRVISRLAPVRGTENHPPNEMVAVEFEPPDFPWLFTPARANDQHQLTPWLVLVVVEQQPGVDIDVVRGLTLPVLRISSPADPAAELPDLGEAWAWAHTQVVDGPGESQSAEALLAGDASKRLSRLLAPRRLAPQSAYHACLVPTFEQGRRAGLGERVDPDETLTPAWEPDASEVNLPMYFHWSFRTGERGDFESMARELEPRKPPAGSSGAPTYLGGMHPTVEDVNGDTDGAVVRLPGALRPPGSSDPILADIADGVKDALPALLDAPLDREDNGTGSVGEPLTPPLYGRWHIKQHEVPSVSPRWFRALNLDPRNRVAAGLGTEVVRRNQDEYMQAAWTQVGDIVKANQVLDLARFGGALLTRLYQKHIQPLPVTDLVKISAPIHALVGEHGRSVATQIQQSRLPETLLGENARRLSSPQHVTRKLVHRSDESATALLHQATETVSKAADESFDADPLGLTFDGIADSDLHRRLTLESADVVLDDLGFSSTLSRSAVTRLRNLGRELQKTPVRPPALRGDIAGTGVLDDRHIKRLSAASGERPLSTALADFLKASRENRGTVAFRIDPGVRELMFRPLDIADGNTVAERPTGNGIAEDPTDVAARPLATIRMPSATAASVGAGLERLPPGRLDRRNAGDPMPRITTRPSGSRTSVRSDASTVVRPPVTAGNVVNRFREAGNLHLADRESRFVPSPVPPPGFAVTAAGSLIGTATVPGDTILKRGQARVRAFGERFTFSGNPSLSDVRILTEVDRILVGPRLPRPLYRDLATMAPESFLPGIGDIESNSIVLLETNPTFVEAFMVGCNYEMGRELLWRGFPTDRRATVFDRFWDRLDGGRDIPDIHRWMPGNVLGKNGLSQQSELVLLLRGALFRRYPGAVVYAVPATDDRRLAADLSGAETPVFSGKLDDETLFCGFSLRKEDALVGPGVFFVIEQQLSEPAFGFDVPADGDPEGPASWQDATWTHAGAPVNGMLRVSGASPLANVVTNSAHLAGVAFQRPFRAAIHADQLLEADGNAG